MARLFDDSSSYWVGVDSAPVTAVPFTISAWIYPDALAANEDVVFIGDKDATNHYWEIRLMATDQGSLGAQAGGSYANAQTGNTANLNAWNHLCGVVASATNRTSVLNGDWANRGTNTLSREPAGADRLNIGRRGDSTPSEYFSGRIAQVAIWNVALNQNEVEALARGTPPQRIRPDALVSFVPLWGLHNPEIDLAPGRPTLTVSDPARANGPPVMMRQRAYFLPGVSGPLVVAIANETVETSEERLRIIGISRIFSETAEAAESFLRVLGLARLRNETAQAEEDTQRNLGLVRSRDETAEGQEGTLKVVGLLRLIAEAAEAVEGAVKLIGLAKGKDETVEASENTQNYFGRIRNIAETAEAPEALQRHLGLARLRNETVEAGEALIRVLGIVRIRNEIAEAAEALLRVVGLVRTRNETTEVPEGTIKAVGRGRVINESAEAAEGVLSRIGRLRVVNEAVEVAEVILRFVVEEIISTFAVLFRVRLRPLIDYMNRVRPAVEHATDVRPAVDHEIKLKKED